MHLKSLLRNGKQMLGKNYNNNNNNQHTCSTIWRGGEEERVKYSCR